MKKKILFYMSSLKGGGAERTIVNIINNINKSKFDVTLVLISNRKHDYIDLVSKDVNIRFLDCSKLRYCLSKLRRIILEEKPDLLFSTIVDNNFTLIISKLLSFKKVPVIVREASNRTQSGNVSRLNKILTYILYNLFTKKVIALSEGVKDDLVKNFYIKRQKVHVIYNPIEIKKIERLSLEQIYDFKKVDGYKYIISVGRLVKQKDFVTLIKAIKLVLNNENVKLIILGKGPEQEALVELSKDLRIEDKVIFLGFKKNPYKYMKLADLFVLSSKWEGFGHVIVEAMAVGTPVISTDCKSGPSEILKDNKYGMLVPVNDHKILAKKIVELLNNKRMRQNYITTGCKRAKDFEAKKIVKEYEELFLSVINE